MSAADDVRRFAADLNGPLRRRAVAAAADELAAAITDQARRVTGGDLTLTGRGRLGVAVRDTAEGATVVATGPWALVERPRRGGYPIRPKTKGGALMVGRGMWRASAVGGAIVAPLRPFARGAERGRQPAVDAAHAIITKGVRNA